MLNTKKHYGYSHGTCNNQKCNDTVCNQIKISQKLSLKNLSKKISFNFQNAKEALKDTSNKVYNSLVSYKNANLKEILQSEELSLNCAIAESCFSYAQENNYLIDEGEMFILAMNLSTSAYNINKITGYNYF